MSKIIKRVDPGLKPVRHTCPKCQSIIEFEEKDIKHGHQLDDPHVECPVCGGWINKNKVWPKS